MGRALWPVAGIVAAARTKARLINAVIFIVSGWLRCKTPGSKRQPFGMAVCYMIAKEYSLHISAWLNHA